MISDDILKLLSERHKEDVFVAECKDGSTTMRNNYLRMDAWVMEKSWSHPRVIGYEIKVARGDFLGDKKWPKYLPLCNELYFAAPKGLIAPNELPAEVGLMEATQGRIITKKKAAYREVQIPESLFRYILMCRAKIGAEQTKNFRVDFWAKWLKEKEFTRDVGYRCSQKLARFHDEAKIKVKQCDEKLEMVKKYLDACQELGITSHTWNVKNKLQEMRDNFATLVPPEVNARIEDAIRVLKNLQATLGVQK
jgi:DNA repair protein MmcB-like